VVSVGLFLAVVSTTVVSVALPTIGRELHAGTTGLEWIVDAYVVVYASLLLAGGVLGDRRGRKGVFLAGVATFGLGSLVCGLAPSVPVLLAGRVLAGLGAALLVPGSLTIIRVVFTNPRQRAAAIGLWSTASGLALAVGPPLGGVIVDGLGWRAVFLVNVPLVVALVLVAARFLPRLAHTPAKTRFDGLGALLSTAAVALLALGVIEGQASGWTSPPVLGAFAAGAAALVGFVAWERRVAGPLIDMSLFTRPGFAAAILAALVVFFAFVGAIVYFSAYFQQVQGHSAVAAGLDVATIGVAYALAATASGRLVGRIGERAPLIAGLVISGIATLGLLRLEPGTGIGAIWWNFALLGAGIGLCGTPMSTIAMSAVDADRAGMASAVLNALRQVGQVFGVAVLGALVYAGLPTGGAGRELDTAHAALFVAGLHHALWVSGLALLAAAAIVTLLLARGRTPVGDVSRPPAAMPIWGTVRGPDARPVDGAALTLIDPNGQEVIRAVTGANGGYRMEVAPGNYVLIAAARSLHPTASRISTEAPIVGAAVPRSAHDLVLARPPQPSGTAVPTVPALGASGSSKERDMKAPVPIATIVDLRHRVRGSVLLPDDGTYQQETTGFQTSLQPRPSVVVGAVTGRDVHHAVRFAAAHDCPVAVQATGHGLATAAHGGVLISTARLTGVRVDPNTRSARLEAGVRWGQVITAAARHGLAPLSGSSPDVGAVSYTLSGGLGMLSRRYGYAADHVRSLEVVTADAGLRHVTATGEPDLFWALRGAGHNFGAVTAMDVDLVPVTRLFGGGLYFDTDRVPEVLHTWRAWTATVPDELTSSLALIPFPDLPAVPAPLRGRYVAHVRIAYTGTAAHGDELVAPLRAVGPRLLDTLDDLPYTASGSIANDPSTPHAYYGTSALLSELDASAQQAILELTGPDAPMTCIVQLNHLGGALARPPAVANAVGHRDARYLLRVVSPLGDDPQAGRAAVRPVHDRLHQALAPCTVGRSLGFHFGDTTTPDQVRDGYNSDDYQRLTQLKTIYDPTNMFRLNHNIAPAREAAIG